MLIRKCCFFPLHLWLKFRNYCLQQLSLSPLSLAVLTSVSPLTCAMQGHRPTMDTGMAVPPRAAWPPPWGTVATAPKSVHIRNCKGSGNSEGAQAGGRENRLWKSSHVPLLCVLTHTLYTYLSIQLFIHLSIHLSISPHLIIHLSVYLYTCFSQNTHFFTPFPSHSTVFCLLL